jgi:death-on-curing protein
MYSFLAINEMRLTASAGETEDFLLGLYGTGSFDFERLCAWLRGNVSG